MFLVISAVSRAFRPTGVEAAAIVGLRSGVISSVLWRLMARLFAADRNLQTFVDAWAIGAVKPAHTTPKKRTCHRFPLAFDAAVGAPSLEQASSTSAPSRPTASAALARLTSLTPDGAYGKPSPRRLLKTQQIQGLAISDLHIPKSFERCMAMRYAGLIEAQAEDL